MSAISVVALSDDTVQFLVERGCFVKPLDPEQSIAPQLDRAAVELAAARVDRTALQYHDALRNISL